MGEAHARDSRMADGSGGSAGLSGIRGLRGSELDRIIHERVRLGIISTLAVNETLGFNDLKTLLDVTDGNLSAHARKLEEAGYLTCIKGYDGRVPRTEYSISPEGREALESYLEHMEALIRAVRD